MKELRYWKQRTYNSLNRTIRDVRPSLDDVEKFIQHVDKRYAKEVEFKVQQVKLGISELYLLVQAVYEEGGENMDNGKSQQQKDEEAKQQQQPNQPQGQPQGQPQNQQPSDNQADNQSDDQQSEK